MASSKEELLNEFLAVAPAAAAQGADGSVNGLTDEIVAEAVLPAYASVAQNSEGSSAAQGVEEESTLAQAASAVFGNALGMAPLAKAVFSLFGGGGGDDTPAPLDKYALPPSLHLEGSSSGGMLEGMDYGQDGLPRAYGADSSAGADSTAASAAAPASSDSGGGAQITIQVQAMDSRSFLDHKDEIAQAVREAMLNSNALNDVVSEL